MNFKKRNKIAKKKSLEAANLVRGERAASEKKLEISGDKRHLISEIDRQISNVEYDLSQNERNHQLLKKLEELKKEKEELTGFRSEPAKKKVVELVYRSDSYNCKDYMG